MFNGLNQYYMQSRVKGPAKFTTLLYSDVGQFAIKQPYHWVLSGENLILMHGNNRGADQPADLYS